MERPSARQLSNRIAVSRHYEWARLSERITVPCASTPPVQVGIDEWVHPGRGLVCVHEILYPGHDRRRVQVVTVVAAAWVVFDVEHTGKGDPVVGPATSVGEEVLSLGGAGTVVGVGVVVTTTNQAGVGSTNVVVGELVASPGGSFSGLEGSCELTGLT